jgi:hypothetical protein
MKVKFNPFVCEKFGNRSIFYEDGVVYYRDQDKIKEFPHQKRSLAKLMKVLKSYSDDTDYRLKTPEMNVLIQLQKSRKRSAPRKSTKTKKLFHWL